MPVLNKDIVNIIAIVLIVVLGSYFRLVDLGNPGFWGDEETSSIPAKSLALGHGSSFVSGMEYRRALPHSFLMAWSAKIFGIDKDRSYRVPSALFGIATLLLIYFSTKKFFGFYVALVATGLLAFSEWHIILSRTARMYGPLLFFSTMFCFATLSWYFSKTRQNLYLLLACVLFVISITFSFLAIIVLPMLFLPSVFIKFDKFKFFLSIALTTILAYLSTLYFKVFLKQPYTEIQHSRLSNPDFLAEKADANPGLFSGINIENADIALILAGTMLGLLVFFTTRKKTSFSQHPLLLVGLLFASLSYGLFLLFGAVYGVLISVLCMTVLIPECSKINTRTLLTGSIILLTPALLISFSNLYNYGIATGLKTSLGYPFPYLLYQAQQFPGVILLFLIGILYSVYYSGNQRSDSIKVLAIIVIVPAFIFGLVESWAPPRYFVTAYPLLIIVASYGLVSITEKLSAIHKSQWRVVFVLLALPSIGLLGLHGLPQAIAVSPGSYGEKIYVNHILGINYPDHRSHGCFVKQHLKDGDIVIAEDALQMHWYIGRVDYWLRTPSNVDAFLYLDDMEELKDIYVNSKPTSDEVIDQLNDNVSDRIWLITSGETQQYLDHFLHKESPQRQWLSNIANKYNPVLNGRDGLSATYCVNCSLQDIKANPWDYDCQ